MSEIFSLRHQESSLRMHLSRLHRSTLWEMCYENGLNYKIIRRHVILSMKWILTTLYYGMKPESKRIMSNNKVPKHFDHLHDQPWHLHKISFLLECRSSKIKLTRKWRVSQERDRKKSLKEEMQRIPPFICDLNYHPLSPPLIKLNPFNDQFFTWFNWINIQ